jgi:hypothetical protein
MSVLHGWIKLKVKEVKTVKLFFFLQFSTFYEYVRVSSYNKYNLPIFVGNIWRQDYEQSEAYLNSWNSRVF